MEPAGQWSAPPLGYYPLPAGLPSWNQHSLASTFSTMTLNQPQQNTEWYFDSGATSHMSPSSSSLSHIAPSRYPTPCSIIVGNGSLLPVTSTGNTDLTPHLHLIMFWFPHNFILVRQFTIDNNCSVEFNPFGCSVKDLLSRRLIVRCNSSGPLYPLCLPVALSLVAATESTL